MQTADHVEEECMVDTLDSSVQVSIRADDAGLMVYQSPLNLFSTKSVL